VALQDRQRALCEERNFWGVGQRGGTKPLVSLQQQRGKGGGHNNHIIKRDQRVIAKRYHGKKQIKKKHGCWRKGKRGGAHQGALQENVLISLGKKGPGLGKPERKLGHGLRKDLGGVVDECRRELRRARRNGKRLSSAGQVSTWGMELQVLTWALQN